MFTEKLIKILNLSTSDNDGESLNAIRLANAMVKKAGLSWEAIIGRGVTSEKPPEPEATELSPEEMFAFIRANAWLGFDFTFIDDVQLKYTRTGRLTARQRIGLIKVYNAVKNDLTRSP